MLQQHISMNNKHFQSSNLHAKVTSLFAIYTSQMMAQDRAESNWVTTSYGSLINQFSSNTIKSMRHLEGAYTKMYRQKMYLLFDEISIYIYIYIVINFLHTVKWFQALIFYSEKAKLRTANLLEENTRTERHSLISFCIFLVLNSWFFEHCFVY